MKGSKLIKNSDESLLPKFANLKIARDWHVFVQMERVNNRPQLPAQVQ